MTQSGSVACGIADGNREPPAGAATGDRLLLAVVVGMRIERHEAVTLPALACLVSVECRRR